MPVREGKACVGVRLAALTREQAEIVRGWRNQSREGLRTPYPLTAEQQAQFYDTVVCDRRSPHRYFAVLAEQAMLVGQSGLTNIEWENQIAEVSLITDPAKRGHGYGRAAAQATLTMAFQELNLQTVFGEIYMCNQAVHFWEKVLAEYRPYWTTLPRRKFWEGRLWDSVYFSVSREDWHT